MRYVIGFSQATNTRPFYVVELDAPIVPSAGQAIVVPRSQGRAAAAYRVADVIVFAQPDPTTTAGVLVVVRPYVPMAEGGDPVPWPW